ncbi:MAG: N-formylglutamate amidohydrolase [Rhodobacteraceae bacterium]|nr:N-formylglutamate amidohydrolase [Paracoccaceae bacterium]
MTYIPYFLIGSERTARWRVTCDHASNTVPPSVAGGDLGLPPEDMARHIAYDLGAWGVSQVLGDLLEAPVAGGNFSRLVIDPNRGEDDPTLVMKLYDGTIIPANRHAGAVEVERRLAEFYRPYDQVLGRLMAPRDAVQLSIHSFTRQLRGRPPRPWHIGILHAGDNPLATALLQLLRAEGDLTVGENEPYVGHLDGDAIDRHALALGRPNVLIELRNDLIKDHAGQVAWATRLAPILTRALAASGL